MGKKVRKMNDWQREKAREFLNSKGMIQGNSAKPIPEASELIKLMIEFTNSLEN